MIKMEKILKNSPHIHRPYYRKGILQWIKQIYLHFGKDFSQYNTAIFIWNSVDALSHHPQDQILLG